MLGIRDLTLKRNGRACSTRPRLRERPPTGNSVALIRAKLSARPCESFGPLILRGFLEKLRAVVRYGSVETIRGDGLEVPSQNCLCVLLALRETAVAE